MEIINFWKLTERQLCDCELILDGSFNPLNGFMTKKDYNSVLETMRLANGKLFPIPIVLDVNEQFSQKLNIDDEIILCDQEGFQIARMSVDSIWEPDIQKEAELTYGTTDRIHPAVNYLFNQGKNVYIGGKIKKLRMPNHYDYKHYRITPNAAKLKFKDLGWNRIIAFQTRNPLHRAHIEMTYKSMQRLNANLFLHPVVGLTKPGDINHYTRVRCYEHVVKQYPKKSTVLGVLPLAMRMGGPREALLHAIIRKNYGCTHIIIGRDHASPGKDSKGKPFYGMYDAQNLLKNHQNEIGIQMENFQFMVYVPDKEVYLPIDRVKRNEVYKTISGSELRDLLEKGKEIPEWFTYPAVASELKKSIPSINKRGFTVFFTGLSGSGKSTIANGLLVKFLEAGARPVTLLDGDLVRTHLSSELGFSKEHRSINVQRIGFVASEITKNGGIAICAPIAPYEFDRNQNRKLISKFGGYIEVFINTSLDKCEERDSKGLYKLARAGKIKQFTGISDPYEIPINADITINSDGSKSPEILVDMIYEKIKNKGYI
ncbi:bifunctional sulfate adenylyltransferase/adenylylsulfate kinase [Candidatus Marinimicrobia bacterium]|nr:bifunctional sulfate adenylyltransferase/adenylylsulfate kinase [Candidatus Neomarinimicrobiota bacterium]